MLDVDDLRAFGQGVVRRSDDHGLRHEPVRAVEYQAQALLEGRARQGGAGGAEVQRQPLPAGLEVGLALLDGCRGHIHGFFRRTGQHHGVARQHQAAQPGFVLEDAQPAGHRRDQHPCGVAVEHVDRHVGHVEVRGRHVDQAAVAAPIVGHHRNRRPRLAAAEVEGVAATPADEFDHHVGMGGGDVEMIIALQRIDQHLFDAGISNEQAGAVDATVGHDKVVAELGAHHGERVEAVATLDLHRRVDGVADEVGACAAVDVGDRRFRVGGVDPHEGAHLEGVVVLLAIHQQVGGVAINDKAVVAAAAEQRRGLADAVGQPALGDLGGGDLVRKRQVRGCRAGRREAGVGIARGLEDLADLEGVVAGVAEDGGDDVVVVQHEVIIAIAAVDDQAAVDLAVVVDPLGDGAAAGTDGHQRMRPEEEGVVAVGAQHLE